MEPPTGEPARHLPLHLRIARGLLTFATQREGPVRTLHSTTTATCWIRLCPSRIPLTVEARLRRACSSVHTTKTPCVRRSYQQKVSQESREDSVLLLLSRQQGTPSHLHCLRDLRFLLRDLLHHMRIDKILPRDTEMYK